MSRAQRAKRVAAVAGIAGAGVGAAGAVAGSALFAVLKGEARLARRRIPQAVEDPPPTDDTVWVAPGANRRRRPVRLVVLGDSTAAGYGVARARDTMAARVALGISYASRRPVTLRNVAVVGAESGNLEEQVTKLDGVVADLAVISVGANDVTHRVKHTVAVSHLEQAVIQLRERGLEVVVGTCPDLGAIKPIAQPLRHFARREARRLAAAQTVAAVGAGGRTVSLGDLLGPVFDSAVEMFSDDRFHPSAVGYQAVAEALVPSCLDALGLQTQTTSASPFTTRRRKPLAKAAAQAAARPGTEVAAPRYGRDRTRLGQIRRRRAPVARPTTPLPPESDILTP